MSHQKSLKGIGFFQLEVLHLISIGKKESIETNEKHIDDGNLIEYIFNKYRDEFSIVFDNEAYDNEALNLFFKIIAAMSREMRVGSME